MVYLPENGCEREQGMGNRQQKNKPPTRGGVSTFYDIQGILSVKSSLLPPPVPKGLVNQRQSSHFSLKMDVSGKAVGLLFLSNKRCRAINWGSILGNSSTSW